MEVETAVHANMLSCVESYIYMHFIQSFSGTMHKLCFVLHYLTLAVAVFTHFVVLAAALFIMYGELTKH